MREFKESITGKENEADDEQEQPELTASVVEEDEPLSAESVRERDTVH